MSAAGLETDNLTSASIRTLASSRLLRERHIGISMNIEFPTKEDLIRWLNQTTSAVLLSISLIGGVQEVHIQASSVRALTSIVQSTHEYFPEGAYAVQYQQSEENESNELIYTNIAVAFTMQVRLARSPERDIGGLRTLRESLTEYEYIAKIEPHQAGYIGQLLIVIPEDPNEIETLRNILEKFSIVYMFPDGTGTINENNLKIGKGLLA